MCGMCSMCRMCGEMAGRVPLLEDEGMAKSGVQSPDGPSGTTIPVRGNVQRAGTLEIQCPLLRGYACWPGWQTHYMSSLK
jgi:hypothetical protein